MASTREKRRKALALAMSTGSTSVQRNPAVASGASGRLSRGAGITFPRIIQRLDAQGLPVPGPSFARPVFVPRRRG